MYSESLFVLPLAQLHPMVGLISDIALACALALGLYRLIRGPHVVDRIIAMDLLASVLLGLALLRAIAREDVNLMNISLAIAVVVFVGTVAMARYLEKGGD